MIVPVMAILNLVLTQQIYSEETNGAHAQYREPVPLIPNKHKRIKRSRVSRVDGRAQFPLFFLPCLQIRNFYYSRGYVLMPFLLSVHFSHVRG